MAILEFKGPYRFLSNFYQSKIIWGGGIFNTVEHFYQAHKATSRDDFEYVRTRTTPGEAKRAGNCIDLISNWEYVKNDVMYAGVKLKFLQHSKLAGMLLDTGRSTYLSEGNNWGDMYWGVDLRTGVGRNELGHILMKVRRYIWYYKKVSDEQNI